MAVLETEFEDLSSVEASGPEQGRILYLGGWRQNPKLMHGMQAILGEMGYSSVGVSAFDTIQPLDDTETELSRHPLLKDLPPRMLRRTEILNELSRTVLRDSLEPTAVLTHCAGANVMLLSKYVSACIAEEDTLPSVGVLAEPMIRQQEGLESRDYFVPFARHERTAKTDPTQISLRAMSPPTETPPTNAEGILPLQDIANSRGSTMLRKALEAGADYSLVLGENDFAANPADIVTSLEAEGVEVPISYYTNQLRFGHGYLLDQPLSALGTIVPILSDLHS